MPAPDLLRAKRDLSHGFSDAFSRGMELALVPAVFGALGWLLDRWLGTDPWLLLALTVFGFAGVIAKMWIGYDAKMRQLEAQLPARRIAGEDVRAPGAHEEGR